MASSEMESYWDQRARENPFRYVDNTRWTWEEDLDAFWRAGEEIVDRLLSDLGVTLTGSEEVVEIGCGVGRLTRALSGRARSVQALDVSAEMLRQAQQLNAGLDNVRWLHGDGRTLRPLPNGAADGCVSFVVFQHLPEPELTYGYVREMGRVLRAGGWAAFQVSNDPAVHQPASLFQRLAGRGRRRAYRSSAWRGSAVEIAKLEEVAMQAGLQIERLENQGTQFCHVLAHRRP